MAGILDTLEGLIREFKRLPGIGAKTVEGLRNRVRIP